MNTFRVFFLAILLLASPFLRVATCQSDSDGEPSQVVEEASDLGVVGEDVIFGSAPGVNTVCVFPKNSARIVQAGAETELLAGVKNDGESSLNIIAIKASVHYTFDHRVLIQNLTGQVFHNATVPPSTQASYPYAFAVSKFLQPGNFDLVGTIYYEIDQNAYQSIFYNGTIEVIEASGFISIETVFLVTLGIALLVMLGLWIHGLVQQKLSKKPKRAASKVEVGTKTVDTSMDEWLQGTAYTQSSSSKSKKKN
ncbi:translocon-associated protein subunit alpha-like [Cucurbita moschata]|uniref:Translocon-associated protein subunit alpha n=2 Tax=Cucurbita TaxID=3660 RepID=A0A6J1EK08_CUCMO